MVAIIDYDAGNIRSVEKAVEYLGFEPIVTRDESVILSASHVILPGDGAFGDAMEHLTEYGLIDVIEKVVEKKIPFLGICLGLQLLFDSSEESPGVKGLSLIPGKVIKIPSSDAYKIPQIGWNTLSYPNRGRLFEAIPENTYAYFVHSYYVHADDPGVVTATTEYGVTVHASVESGNIFGCQYHPEKSSDMGLKMLANFLRISEA